MAENKPLILVADDDGVCAEGLKNLVRVAREFGDVIVLAPECQQSGKSNAVTSGVDVLLHQVSSEPGLRVYACSGTPTDSVKLSFYSVCRDRRPDLILSGINHGSNSSINVVYSGTMGAVIEGCLNGIPSIGFSLCLDGGACDYSYGLPYVRQVLSDVLCNGLPTGICLNVNFPAGPIEGPLRWCRQARSRWVDEFSKTGERDGSEVFRLGGDFVNLEPDTPGTDEYLLARHQATCVPIRVDMTADDYLRQRTCGQ